MYRQAVYLKKLHNQLKAIMQTSDRGCLTITPNNNSFFYAANLMLGFAPHLANDLINKKEKKVQEYVYLLVALKLTNQSYHPQLSEFKEKFPEAQKGQTVDRLVQYFESAVSIPEPKDTKAHLQRKFQLLTGKATSEDYFSIPEVPAFLISTKWLQKFFSSQMTHPGPIYNQILLEQAEFPLSEANFSHYNYQVKSDVRQNEDFRIVPYQAWNLLMENYGGVEVRRYTTRQKRTTVEIWYARANIWVVQQRSILTKIQLLVGKNDSIQQILDRLRLTLKKYEVVPESYLARQPTVFKVNGLQFDQFTALLHNDSQSHLLAQRMHRIKNIAIEFEDTGIFSSRQGLVVNFGRGSTSVFDNAPLLKVIDLKQKCLRCGTTENLVKCKCGTVYFCSVACRQAKKQHLKQCNSLQGEARKYAIVTQFFQVARKSYPNLGPLIPKGKVGLQNLGNTCYMNSALQCVLRIEPISNFFLKNQHLKDLNVGNVLGSEGYLACAYGQLVKTFYTTGRRSLEPTAVLRVMQKNPQFRGYNHQDSQEFLNYFLDKLHEDLNRIRQKPYTQQIQSNGRPDEEVSQLSWQNYLKRNRSMIVDTLAGQYRSQIRCPDCNKLSITFDPFLSLTLQFPRPEKSVKFEGWIMNENGEFQKIQAEVGASMPSHEFYQKYFHTNVFGVYQREKKITDYWDHNKTVFQNQKPKGVLFFYQKPMGYAIRVEFQINSPGKKDPQNFVRIVFAKQILGQDQLYRLAYKSIRKPLQKAMGKDYNENQYYDICKQLDFIKINKINCVPQRDRSYPFTGSMLLKVEIELDQSKLKLQSSLKLNTGSGKYQSKSNMLVRKVGNQITMTELLQCFSEPQKLTQENAWYCNVCKDHKLADKAMQLYKTPKFLIVHLKRFNHRGDSGNRFIIYGEKVNTPIALEQFQTIKGKKYELIGVVNHIGSLMYGHYTSMVKRGEWYNYDDSRCSRTSLDGSHAYLLFYQLAE